MIGCRLITEIRPAHLQFYRVKSLIQLAKTVRVVLTGNNQEV
jgi:hypothetical protein